MNEEKTIKKFFQNRDVLKWVIIGLAGFVILVLVFGAGVKVGTLKAKHSYKWAENYHKNFAGPRDGFWGDWRKAPREEFIEGHGTFGEIIEVKDNGFVIRGRDDVEQIVVTSENTIVKKGMGMKTAENSLKVGDRVVVIGSPNDQGQIEAKLIRLFGDEAKKESPDTCSYSRFFKWLCFQNYFRK